MIIPKFSFFDNVFASSPRKNIDLLGVIELIKSETFKSRIEFIRNLKTSGKIEESQKKKKALPAVTIGGIFSDRKTLIEPSNIVCVDIDGLGQEQALYYKSLLVANYYTLACFLSPRGEGLKVLFRSVFKDNKEYNDAWLYITRYLKKNYGLDVDKQAHEINRLCSISYDSEPYYNLAAKTFIIPRQITEPRKTKPFNHSYIDNSSIFINKAARAYILAVINNELKRVREAKEGTRNKDLYIASKVIAKYFHSGLFSEALAKEYLLDNYLSHEGVTQREGLATINSGWNSGLLEPKEIPTLKKGGIA